MSPANSIGFPFIELRKVESTNNYAMRLVHEGMAHHGTVVFAHEQTKGKGQRNKQWVSAPDQNIMLSVVVDPFELHPSQIFLLSMSVANAVHTFFSEYAGEQTKIKWPNDLYWCDRKAGGILIENIIQGRHWKKAIIGIGLNINQTDFGDFKKAVSLKMITGRTFNRIELAKELLNFLNLSFANLIESPEDLIEKYQENLYKRKQKVDFKRDQNHFQGLLEGVNINGQLVVKTGDEEQLLNVGEVDCL